MSGTREDSPLNPRTPIRHGEVLLLPVAEVPAGHRADVDTCIVGHSESGHHHVLESDHLFAQIVAANGDLFVDLDTPTPLRHHKTHQQHRELLVPAGAWKVVTKTEFDVRSLPLRQPDPRIVPEADPSSVVPEYRRMVRD